MLNKTIIGKIILVCSLIFGSFGFSSCDSDEKITQELPAESYLKKAKEILNGDIVLSTRATMNGVDKTLLPQGCPTIFGFEWKEDDKMIIDLTDFTVGVMPFAVTFRCACKLMQLNTWEKDEYKGEGWIKFLGKDGNVTSQGDKEADNQTGSGASVQGYINVNTLETEFIINYNMMNVRTETFLQKIDKSRINNFEQEFYQYEEDLAKYKEEHGL